MKSWLIIVLLLAAMLSACQTNLQGEAYGSTAATSTHEYTGYDRADRVAEFVTKDGTSTQVTVDSRGRGYLLHQGVPFRIIVRDHNVTNARLLVDVNADRIVDIGRTLQLPYFALIAPDEFPMTHRYVRLTAQDEDVWPGAVIEEIQTGGRATIPLDVKGNGYISYNDKQYRIRSPQWMKGKTSLRVDIDGEGSLDILFTRPPAEFPLLVEECGDLTCDGTETCTTCPQDCSICPPACNDGVDNDMDGLIDLLDHGCAAFDDNDELDTSDYDGDSCPDAVDPFPTIPGASDCGACGDGICQPGEEGNCEIDCLTCPRLYLENSSYRLESCSINTSMVDGAGNLPFNITIVQEGQQRVFGFTVYGYGEGFPTYGTIGTSSGGAQPGGITIGRYFNDAYLTANGNQSRIYSGFLPIKVYYGSAGSGPEIWLNYTMNLVVLPG